MVRRNADIDQLVADLRHACEHETRAVSDAWLSELGWRQFHGFFEAFLGRLDHATRYLVEDAVFRAAEKIRADLLTLRDPSSPNVRARLDQCCRREMGNELSRLRVRLRLDTPPDAPDPVEQAPGPEDDRPDRALDAQDRRELLCGLLAEAAEAIPEAYQVGLWVELGREQREIAALLGKTPRTVRNNLDTLRWFLVSRLLAQGFDEAEVAGVLNLPRSTVTDLIARHHRRNG